MSWSLHEKAPQEEKTNKNTTNMSTNKEEIDVDVGELHCGERVQGRKAKWQSPLRTARARCASGQGSQVSLSMNHKKDFEAKIIWKRKNGWKLLCADCN